MNRYEDLKKRNPFPYTYFKLGNNKYTINKEKINSINKDLKIFLNENQNSPKKINKKKNKRSLSIDKIIENLISNSTKNASQIIKKFNMNFHKNNIYKRFMNASDINIYKKRKIKLLNLIRDKNKNNKNISLNNNKSYIGRNKSAIFNNNNLSNDATFHKDIFDNNILFSTKSFSNKTFFKKNENNKKKIFIKRKSNSFINSIENQNTNYYSNMNNISSNAYNEIESNDNNYKKKKSILNNNNDNIFDTYTNISEDMKNVYQKIALYNLKLEVHKYERSKNYIPNSDIIQDNLVNPFHFVRKKFTSNFEKNSFILNKKENNKINNKKKIRRIYSASKYPMNISKLNKTITPTRKENSTSNSKSKDNTKILIKKINNIKKTLKIKKNILIKNRITNITSVNNVMDYFYNKPTINYIDKMMYKDLKNDVNKYNENIGIFNQNKKLHQNHIEYVINGDKIVEKIFKSLN